VVKNDLSELSKPIKRLHQILLGQKEHTVEMLFLSNPDIFGKTDYIPIMI